MRREIWSIRMGAAALTLAALVSCLGAAGCSQETGAGQQSIGSTPTPEQPFGLTPTPEQPFGLTPQPAPQRTPKPVPQRTPKP
jgi:hypothetical protein